MNYEVISVSKVLGLEFGTLPPVKPFNDSHRYSIDLTDAKKILRFPRQWVHPRSYYFHIGMLKLYWFELHLSARYTHMQSIDLYDAQVFYSSSIDHIIIPKSLAGASFFYGLVE